ncbi:MAG: type II toxin-antitoxin system RelE/ParE family toxin [Dehalococcoidia bacterium]|nr:type II toxin-antitoxin system RelE/ParE family toxin [Dehalococcoidia bacterium]
MTYALSLSRESQRYLRQCSPDIRRRLTRRIEQFAEDPFRTDISKPLHGPLQGARSSRVGDLRIIYEVSTGLLLVSIVRISPRGQAYRS